MNKVVLVTAESNNSQAIYVDGVIQIFSNDDNLLADDLLNVIPEGPVEVEAITGPYRPHEGWPSLLTELQSVWKNRKQLEPHQLRVVAERKELGEKMDKLHAFIRTKQFKLLSEAEQARLQTQLQVMNVYEDILRQRIEAFGIELQVFDS